MLRPPSLNRFAVITGLGLTQILAWGSSFYLPAVLAAPIAADTGWPLPSVVGALSAGLLISGLISPRVGRAIGTMGGRPVLALSSLLLAAGLLILAAAPILPVFVLGWLVLGAGMGCGLYDAAFATLGRLYGAAARPAITALTLWGGFASTVCWPLSAYLVAELGWRLTCVAYAAIQLGVSLPLLLWLVPRTPPLLTAEATGPRREAPLTGHDRIAFLLLACVFAIGNAIGSTIAVHLLTLLQAQGVALAAAVSIGALMGPSQVSARLVEMAAGGRHHPLWTLRAAAVLMALGLVLLWAGYVGAAAALVLFGAGNGIFSIARGTLPLALFGPEHYAPLVGRLAAPSFLAQALAPFLGALIITHLGSTPALATLAVLGLVNVLLVAALWVSRMKP